MTRAGQVFLDAAGLRDGLKGQKRPGAYPPALQSVGEAILTKPDWHKKRLPVVRSGHCAGTCQPSALRATI